MMPRKIEKPLKGQRIVLIGYGFKKNNLEKRRQELKKEGAILQDKVQKNTNILLVEDKAGIRDMLIGVSVATALILLGITLSKYLNLRKLAADPGLRNKAYRGLNPWKILGVSRRASQEAIKKAYKKLVRIYHPDLNGSPEAAEKIRKIIWAYQQVKDKTIPKVPFSKAIPNKREIAGTSLSGFNVYAGIFLIWVRDMLRLMREEYKLAKKYNVEIMNEEQFKEYIKKKRKGL